MPTGPGFDQIAQGMGGLMSITGLPGQGPVRVGIPIADLTRRPVLRHRHPDRAARAREVGQGPVGRDLAAAGADLHARLPGGALADRRRGAEAGRQQSSDLRSRPACSRPPTATSTSPPPASKIWERFCRGARRAGAAEAIRTTRPRRRARRTATRSTPRSTATRDEAHQRRLDRAASTRPACRAGRSTRSTRCSPIRRSSISASRRP